MGLMISAFEALTLLPPDQEVFRCFYSSEGVYARSEQTLETVSSLAETHYTADLGYRKTAKSYQLGFRFGHFFFPVTKDRVNKMLSKYGYTLSEDKEYHD